MILLFRVERNVGEEWTESVGNVVGAGRKRHISLYSRSYDHGNDNMSHAVALN